MAIEDINLGTSPTGAGGDTVRSAFEKTKGNFSQHEQRLSSIDILIPDQHRRAVEAATGGLCTVERTPNGQPCYMHVLSKTRAEDLAPGGELGTGMHEAFVVNGQERSTLLIGMFLAAEVNGELVSQPGREARTRQNFDTQMAAAQALGAGWHQMTIWEWAFVSLWCMANGFEPRGNTNYGRSHSHPFEVAARTDGLAPGDSGLGYTYTGYGPNTWRHNAAPNGIADLVGNVWERLNLMKIVDGRVMLAPDNDPSLSEADWTDTGWDMPGNGTWAASDNAGASDALKRALVVPNGTLDPGGYLYTNLTGERLPIRGGGRIYGGSAGLGALSLHYERGGAHSNFGLRLARLVS
ncbi:hypothetical protein GN155_017815 [Alcanivorax sp. ZXX171]|nr:hypothetical protein [Alcanivorax sp. ZXX171]